jgi:hypothetical protein
VHLTAAARARACALLCSALPSPDAASSSVASSIGANGSGAASETAISGSGSELEGEQAGEDGKAVSGAVKVPHRRAVEWIQEMERITSEGAPAATSLQSAVQKLQRVPVLSTNVMRAEVLPGLESLLGHACACSDLRVPLFLHEVGSLLGRHQRLRASVRKSEACRASSRVLLERAAESDETYADKRWAMAVATATVQTLVAAPNFWRRLAQSLPDGLAPNQAAKLYWAYAHEDTQRGRVADAAVCTALERAVVPHMPALPAVSVANVCRAAASLPACGNELRIALPEAVERCASKFKVLEAKTVLLALSRLGEMPAQGVRSAVFGAIERAAPQMSPRDFYPVLQSLINFGVVPSDGLRDALCTALERLHAQGKLDALRLSDILPVLSRSQLAMPDTTRASVLGAVEAAAPTARAFAVARTAPWVMSQSEHLRSPALEAVLFEAAGRSAPDMTAAQASALLEALGARAPPDVIAMLVDVAERDMESSDDDVDDDSAYIALVGP